MKFSKFAQSLIPALAVIAAAVYNIEALMFFMNIFYVVIYLIFSIIFAALLMLITVAYIRNIPVTNYLQDALIKQPFWCKVYGFAVNGIACYFFFESGYKWPSIMFVVAWVINIVTVNVIKDLSKQKIQ